MDSEKVAAIVPAFNEEKNIASVLKILVSSEKLDEVIVVDDGSKDKTAEVSEQLGAKVLRLEKNIGKARAMRRGVESTDANIIAFFDADLLGLNSFHVDSLVNPVLNDQVVMTEGVRDRWWGLPALLDKMFPIMFAICGERVIRREILMHIPEKYIRNMTDGIVMNYYCRINALPVAFVPLNGLDIVVKEKKVGILRALILRIKMVAEFVKIRIIISINKKDFYVQKNNIR